MKKSIIIAGMAAVVMAGAAAGGALAQAQAQGSADRQAGQPAGPGVGGPRGERMGPGGPGGRLGARGFRGMRERPSLEQLQQRNAERFARIDANKDGRATLQEFQAFRDRQRQERERAMFQRFSGGQDSVTLAQLNARIAERYNQGPGRRGAPAAPPPSPAPAR